MFKKLLVAGITGLALMAATAVHALPNYTSGSFAYSSGTDTTTDVLTTTVFHMSFPNLQVTATTDDMAPLTPFLTVIPLTTLIGGNIDFMNFSTFGFSSPTFGTFTPTGVNFLGTSVSPPNATASWDVIGTFTVGSLWTNPGTVISADLTIGLTQTGGPGHAISISGTFDSPRSRIPEPGVLALMGLSLGGLVFLRRRRDSKF